ncbi:hypothetical protein NQ317_016363 [Molorchus minor]|uniref:Cytochrome P450 n=1 Tax=Molorchus minor TaxID=1323400 RepID=A0ABQ9JG58_9CUCU|nr:hypothetical protein NQ317_016363 [Molorchus minor]
MTFALNKYSEIKSDVVRVFLGTKLFVALMDARDVEIILGSNVHIQKSDEYALFEPWLGDGLLISKGEKWKSHRKMIAPTFHSSILKSFMPVFNKNAQNLIDSFTKELGKTFDVHDYMSGTTVDTLLETAMGVKKTDEDNTGFEYAMSVMKMCNILHLRHYKIWLRPDFIFKFTKMCAEQSYLLNIIHALTRQVIKRKKENFIKRDEKGEQSLYQKALKSTTYNEKEGTVEETASFNYIRDDLDENDENDIGNDWHSLDFMIEASQTKGNQLSDDEIKEEVDTIMFEGHDTTAAASSFVLSILGVHHDIQDKVFQELKDIFQDDLYRPITFNDTVQMKYLERVILETLRMYPPVPIIARVVNEDVKLGRWKNPTQYRVKSKHMVGPGSSCMLSTMFLYLYCISGSLSNIDKSPRGGMKPIGKAFCVPTNCMPLRRPNDTPRTPTTYQQVHSSGDYTLPSGTSVIIGTFVIHRNPKYYPNPEKFDPDNFLPERCQDRPYYAYIPFSAGPRSCVGRKYAMLKLKVLLASVLRRFRTISDKDEKDFKLQADIILKREDGFHIRVEERVV